MMDGYPQFLAPYGALSLRAIAIGLLEETFSVLIINPLQAILDAETDLSQSGQVCVLASPELCHTGLYFEPFAEEVMSHSRMGFNINWLIIFGGCLVLSVFIANFAS